VVMGEEGGPAAARHRKGLFPSRARECDLPHRRRRRDVKEQDPSQELLPLN
jgi:hypothetical protein